MLTKQSYVLAKVIQESWKFSSEKENLKIYSKKINNYFKIYKYFSYLMTHSILLGNNSCNKLLIHYYNTFLNYLYPHIIIIQLSFTTPNISICSWCHDKNCINYIIENKVKLERSLRLPDFSNYNFFFKFYNCNKI